jgi:nicotinate-nucleotide adenylyltransferase
MTIRLPRWTPGQRIGLMGGSFNPAHEGHLLASRLALQRLRLDRLWWLVTPGNPLKELAGLPSLTERIEAARALARDPRIAVTGFEADIGARFTHDTIAWLVRRAPSAHFVWIMGADNLCQFHLWRRWRDIARLVPIAVVDRPGSTLRALTSHAGVALAPFRVAERDATNFAERPAPAFIFLHGPRSSLSSTAIRRFGSPQEAGSRSLPL